MKCVKKTWKEDFGECDHFHKSKTYHSSFCVVTIFHTISEASAQRHHVLPETQPHINNDLTSFLITTLVRPQSSTQHHYYTTTTTTSTAINTTTMTTFMFYFSLAYLSIPDNTASSFVQCGGCC